MAKVTSKKVTRSVANDGAHVTTIKRTFDVPKKSGSVSKKGGGPKKFRLPKGLSQSDYDELLDIEANNSEQIVSALNRAMAEALEEIGLAAERFAKRETPVDTGRLRNSITHVIDMDDEAVYIGTNVEYAGMVENGTSKREGVHMLQHAASNHGDYYRNIVKKHLENA